MTTITLTKADITTLPVDAIVNAANTSLLGGGGVDGAIHRAAGRDLLEECKTLNGCQTGMVKITRGYNLPAKYIIHAVGPRWRGGTKNEAALLASCYQESLQLADTHHLKSIAFPAISCGIYGYPINEAVRIAVNTVKQYLQGNTQIEEVTFVCFDDAIYNAYSLLLNTTS